MRSAYVGATPASFSFCGTVLIRRATSDTLSNLVDLFVDFISVCKYPEVWLQAERGLPPADVGLGPLPDLCWVLRVGLQLQGLRSVLVHVSQGHE